MDAGKAEKRGSGRTAADPPQPGWQRDERRLKVFISYSRRDSLEFARALVDALDKRGLAAVLDERNLQFGYEWQQQLKDFIRLADAIIFVVSPGSIASKWCRWEVAEVATQSKRLVPVVHLAVPPEEMPAEIGNIQLFKLRPQIEFQSETEFAARCDRLAEGLQKDREWLQNHTRYTEDAYEWMSNERSPDRLLRGQALLGAERWVARRPLTAPAPSQAQLEYISASQAAQKRRARQWVGGLAALALGAVVLAGAAVWQWREAVAQRIEAQLSNAKTSASLADSLLQTGQRREALKTLLNALPTADQTETLPVLDAAIYRALWFKDDRTSVAAAYFSSIDHAKIYGDLALVSSSEGQTIALLDFRTGKTVQHFETHPGHVKASAMSAAKDRVAVITEIAQRPALREFLVSSARPLGGPESISVPIEALSKPSFVWFDQEADLVKKAAFENGAKIAWEGSESFPVSNIEGSIKAIAQDQRSAIVEIGEEVFALDLMSKSKRVLPGAKGAATYSLAADGRRAIELDRESASATVWDLLGQPAVIGRGRTSGSWLISLPEDAWGPRADRYALIGDQIEVYCLPDFQLCQQIPVGEWSALAIAFSDNGSILRVIMQPPGRFGLSLVEVRLNELSTTHRVDDLDEFFLMPDGSTVLASTNSEFEEREGAVETKPNSGAVLSLQATGIKKLTAGDHFRSLVPFKERGFGVLANYRPTKLVLDSQDGNAPLAFPVGDKPDKFVITPAGDIFVEEDGEIGQYNGKGEKTGSRRVGIAGTFSGDGLLYSDLLNDRLVVTDVESGREVAELPLSEQSEIKLLDHDFILVQPRKGDLILKKLTGARKDRPIALPGVDLNSGRAAIDAEGRYLAISNGAQITIHDLATSQSAIVSHGASLDVGINDHVTDMFFLPRTNFVVSGGSDGKVKLWTVAGVFVADLIAFPHGVDKVQISSTGERVCARSGSHVVTATLLPTSSLERIRLAQRAVDATLEVSAP